MTKGLAVGSALFILACVVSSPADATDKCKAVDPDPGPGRTVQWSGACAGGLATGPGVAEISANGAVVRRIEGNFAKGAVAGPAKITDFDGGKIALVTEGSDDGPVKLTRYKNDAVSTVTEFARHHGVADNEKKITFYRDGVVASIETGLWLEGKLSGSCSVERYKDGRLTKAYSGICLGGVLSGPAKVHIYESSPGHDVLFEGPYANGLLEGQGSSSEILTAASAAPNESCLKPGDITLHYDGDWTANQMNGQGTIDSDFCAPGKAGMVQRVHMSATGGWAKGDEDGETQITYVVDGAAPIRMKRVYDHGAILSETLLSEMGGEPVKDEAAQKENLCSTMAWACAGGQQHTRAPFAARL